MPKLILLLFLLYTTYISAQDKPYFYNIPEAPAVYNANTTVARMIDGLGFRYYWASYDLNEPDLAFKPNTDARTTRETLEHIDGLTEVILNTMAGKKVTGNSKKAELSYEELRNKTLLQIRQASDLLKNEDVHPENLKLQFGDTKSDIPFWNLINGPIADAIWHVGQVVSFRRSSGNPLPAGVDVLLGVKKE